MLEKLKNNLELKSKIKFIIIMIALTIFGSYPYLPEGTIAAHDLCYHLNRIQSTSEELANGIFPVFIHSNLLNGFGYGNPLFYPELFIYIPILLLKLGFGMLFSYKVLIMLTTFSTLLITFYSANIISKDRKISWITTLLYSFSLYRFVDIYARGALGEILAFTFLPLIFAGLYDIIYGENKRWYLIPIAMFCVMNSHVLSFAMIVVLTIFLCIINIVKIFKDKKKTINVFLAGILSILIISSYTFTYIEQKSSDKVSVDIHENSVNSMLDNASGIQEAFWNELKNTGGYTTRAIGLLLLILPTSSFFIKNKKESKQFKFYMQVYFIGMFVWYMSLNLFPWENFEFLNIIQFPYRLNIISTLCLSFVAGYAIISAFDNKEDIFKVLIIVILLIAATHLSQVAINEKAINFEILMSGPSIANGEYKPVGFTENDKNVYTIDSPENLIPFEKKGSKITFKHTNEEDELQIHVPLAYYKGYKAYIIDETGEKIILNVDKDEGNGHLRVWLDEKITGTIVVEYKMTIIQKIGYGITILTLIGIIIYIIEKRKEKTIKKEIKIKKGKIKRKEILKNF